MTARQSAMIASLAWAQQMAVQQLAAAAQAGAIVGAGGKASIRIDAGQVMNLAASIALQQADVALALEAATPQPSPGGLGGTNIRGN